MPEPVFVDDPQGLDKMNGADCYEGFEPVAYNPSVALDEYAMVGHRMLSDPRGQTSTLFASLTHRGLSACCEPAEVTGGRRGRLYPGYKEFASDYSSPRDFSRLVGRFRFVEDRFTGPFCLRDLSMALALVDFVWSIGGACFFEFQQVGGKDMVVLLSRAGDMAFREQAINACRILGWITTGHSPPRLELAGNPEDAEFYTHNTRRRERRSSSPPHGLAALMADFRSHVWSPRQHDPEERWFHEYLES